MNSCLPPASRREANRRSRADAILDVAARSFLEHGYGGTTMSAIAAQLGGSKGTLWSYFPSKEVLFAAVIDRKTEAFRAQLALVLNPNDGIEATVKRFCTELLRKVTLPEAIALHRLVIGETKRFPELGRIFYERAPRQTQQLLARFIEAAMERRELRQDDPLIAARLLNGLCLCGSHQQMLMGVIETVPPDILQADIDRAAATFLAAYAA